MLATLKAGSRRQSAFDLDVGRERRFLHLLGLRHRFQFDVAPLQYLHNLWIETGSRFGNNFLHRLVERQRAAILAVRRQRGQAIHRRENSRSNRNIFTLQTIRITRAVPFFMMRAHNGSHRVREAHALQNLRAHHRVDLHLLELFPCQFAGLRDDMFRNRELSDIVQ